MKLSRTTGSAPLIALVGWNSVGHYPTFFRLYCRALLELGCSVAAICPEPASILAGLRADGAVAGEGEGRIRFRALSMPTAPPFGPQKLRAAWHAREFAGMARSALAGLEAEFGRRVDLVFFDCLRPTEERWLRRMVTVIDRPWSGLNNSIRSTSAPFSLETLLRHPRLRSVAVLDDALAPLVQSALGKPAIVFPEMTDDTLEPGHPLGQRFRRFANGAKLVLSIGHLRPNKGVSELARLALDPRAREFAFVFAGTVPWGMFTQAESESFRRVIHHAPGTLFHHHRIPDGAVYNAAVQAADVLFASYQNFAGTSSTLTKAAITQRPVIVSETSELMARHVRDYRLGEVIPDHEPETILAALRRLTDAYPAWVARTRPRWEEYREIHSYRSLVKAFARVLESAAA